MHDKPDHLESLCIDALCHNVIAFCDQNYLADSCDSVDTIKCVTEDEVPFTSEDPAFRLGDVLPGESNNSAGSNDSFTGDNSRQFLSDNLKENTGFAAEPARLTSLTQLNNVTLSTSLSNALICRLGEKGQLNDRTLTFFDKRRTRLSHVKIANPNTKHDVRKSQHNLITHEGLSILKQHRLSSLQLINLDGIKLDRLVVENLSFGTVKHLKLLDLSGTLKIKHFTRCDNEPLSSLKSQPASLPQNSGADSPTTVAPTKIPGNSAFLCKFNNLQTLIVARTNFDYSSLMDICDHMIHLKHLNLSHTSVTGLEPLLKLRDSLTVLVVQKPRFHCTTSAIDVIAALDNLTVLDVSGYPPKNTSADRQKISADGRPTPPVSFGVALVRRLASDSGSRLSNLQVLDISGSQANFEINVFSSFLNTHRKLEFCGLLMSNACYFDCILTRTDLKVSGEADREQVFTALQTYWSRDYFCSRSFYLLFRMLEMDYSTFTDDDKTFCLKHIFDGMMANMHDLNVQMAGTACLYNLCREERAKCLHPAHLSRIVDNSLRALEIHSTTLQLHKNVWLTLCNDHILQSGTFDLFRCCLVALESMVNCNEAQVTRITVAIVSILAAKIPTEWTARLGANRTYMKFLLQVVNQKNNAHELWLAEHSSDQQNPPAVAPLPDLTLKFTLSALWNLTDESPATCMTFLEENGLKIVLRVLELFNDHSIEAKVLGLLNNVAEVGHLKAHLVNQSCLTTVKRILLCNKIDVSYFAAGILAHLCADMSWDHFQPSWDDCLELLGSTVRSWDKTDFEMVAYRSFKPFFSLLGKTDIPEVQFWALWAIHHVCSNNRERYVDMFKEQNGKEALEKVRDTTLIKCPHIYVLCTNILDLLR